jgi:hypothetical protein
VGLYVIFGPFLSFYTNFSAKAFLINQNFQYISKSEYQDGRKWFYKISDQGADLDEETKLKRLKVRNLDWRSLDGRKRFNLSYSNFLSTKICAFCCRYANDKRLNRLNDKGKQKLEHYLDVTTMIMSTKLAQFIFKY